MSRLVRMKESSRPTAFQVLQSNGLRRIMAKLSFARLWPSQLSYIRFRALARIRPEPQESKQSPLATILARPVVIWLREFEATRRDQDRRNSDCGRKRPALKPATL